MSAAVIQNWQTPEDIKTWMLFANSALPLVACPSGRITCSYPAAALRAFAERYAHFINSSYPYAGRTTYNDKVIAGASYSSI